MNKVGFKHYKDHDGKNIKYYEWVSINYIDDNGNKASKKYTNSNYIVSGIEDAVKGNFIITYNDKFESAVIKSKENISNIHRIISIWFGNEIVEEKYKIKDFNPSPISGLHPAINSSYPTDTNDELNRQRMINGFYKRCIGKYEPRKSNKTHRYPLIYKLKERQDYKSVKEKFDEDIRSGECDYILLVYNHEEDRFYREFFKTEEKNITVLDSYKK